jgi:Zn-dependent peptidase ImmA (M78 family)
MMEKLGVGYLPYRAIATRAEDFFMRLNPTRVIPVPIEEIAEFKLGVNIIPIPNLQKTFEVEGFISSDLQNIYVDQFILYERPTRYRFTLAHEIGHIFLHRFVFEKLKIEFADDWRRFVEEIDDQERSAMEFQGYAFAGLVLVPPKELEAAVRENMKELHPSIQACREKDIPREDYLSYALDRLSATIAPLFDVSTDVIEKRIGYDKLERMIP